ncbi:hypothetical protein B14_200025 (plasmid) [Bacillus licheniformis]|jgi:hypothetical protein|uniref:hypothetical protein n=1 Tax=Bacillus subtilis group TaxID=653685 RepID=UPI0009C30FD2|nr:MULTISPECIES: hypothetical protein [Bacillus subtilis group]ARC67236.1 hypothetical protein B14_200025 [Bacillus licheniformis]ARW46124.1 hypothetical protein S100141_04904 [Bacillus licheniformis]TWK10958.1 hypothetical protein CHCC20442_1412 [Bacillus licheniformis]TWN01037.1 hypothetical protein CHCC14566_0258 [Bacillus licheniformis]
MSEREKGNENMNAPVLESSKERIQRLLATGAVRGFRSDDDGKILINPNDPKEKEWMED